MLQFNFDPFPVLETDRLLLRAIAPGDKHEVFALRSDKELMQHIGKPLMTDISEAEKHIKLIMDNVAKNENINWVITLKGDPRFIGLLGFYRVVPEHHRSEVGYMLLKEFHRQGIMHEALGAIIRYGFDVMGFHQLEAITAKENVASQDLLLKNKFTKEAHFKENFYFEGEYLDSVHYCRLSDRK